MNDIKVECIGIGSKKVFSAWEIGCMKILQNYKNMCIGLSSECEDKQHVIFLDYDGIKFDWLLIELDEIVKNWRLGHFIILETGTKNHYLCICLNKVNLKTFREIMQIASVDKWFKKVNSLYRDQAIIRISHRGNTPQPNYKCTLKCDRLGNTISLSHYNFLKKTLGYNLPNFSGCYDTSEKVKIFIYGSNKN